MRQRTKNHRNQGSIEKKIRFFSKFLRHISRWVRFVHKTQSKNSHAWAPLNSVGNVLALPKKGEMEENRLQKGRKGNESLSKGEKKEKGWQRKKG
jgi:hypothetical protein